MFQNIIYKLINFIQYFNKIINFFDVSILLQNICAKIQLSSLVK